MNITTIPESISNLDYLEHLNISHNNLTTLPQSICQIYPTLEGIDLANNFICPPYLECIEDLGYQNTRSCDFSDEYDQNRDRDHITDTNINSIYFQNDLDVLQRFIDVNKSLEGKNALEIGQQKWKNMRLVSLDLSDKELTEIPASICSIFPNLESFDISNNAICPPYPKCIEYISIQDRQTCGNFTCPENFVELEGECYYEFHLNILQDFINTNISLQGIQP